PLAIAPDSSAWFAWLDELSSFAFQGRVAHYTARKEQSPRGEGYWYAYLGVGNKLSKRYLGETTNLTLARLEQVASELQATSEQAEARRRARTAVISARAGESGETAHPSLHQGERPESPNPLLVSKLQVPRLRAHFVPRAHLVERLQRALE